MPKTLLLADDSPTIQRVVALTFAGDDVTVVSVSDGDQAVEALNRSRPDVVLADIAMPGRNGYELADYMRQSSHLADVPVLLLASAFERVDSDRARAVGARGIISKPFDPAIVVGRVRELLREPARIDAINAPTPEPVDAVPEPERRAEAALESPTEIAEAPSEGLPDLPLQASGPLQSNTDLDRYFEQLDRAFDELKASRRLPEDAAPITEEQLFDVAPQPPHAVAPEPPVAAPRAAVSLTDAFSALLAAECGVGAAETSPETVHATSPVSAAIDMDALVEQVTARVLAQMSDRVVHETVSDILLATAERLVRDEIERIKRDVE